MEVEEIVIHCLILAVVLVNSVLLFQVWKYLNSKPPGMQTILHELAKDGILLTEAQLIINWITWVKVVPQVNYYVAMIAVKTALFIGISFLCQMAIFSVVRYQHVFHFDYINSIDDTKIKFISRASVGSLALVCALSENVTKIKKFVHLTQIEINENFDFERPISIIPILIVSLSITLFVQCRIVYHKSQNPIDVPQHDLNQNDSYNIKIVSFACIVIMIIGIIAIFSLFSKVVVIARLLLVLNSSIFAFVIFVMLIYSNDQMFLYVWKKLTPQSFNIVVPNNSQNAQQPLSDQDNAQDHNHSQNQDLPMNPFVIPKPINHPNASGNFSTTKTNVYSISAQMNHNPSSLPDVSV